MVIEVLRDALFDTAKLFPFLFLTYLAMEYLETRAGEKTTQMLLGAGRKGPLIGGILGIVPQCGFSAAAANLYSGGVITVGTLVAVFLSTSDEMLPILISGRAKVKVIVLILLAKMLIAVFSGILVDFAVRVIGKGGQRGLHIHEICEHDHCHCEGGSIWKPALIHSLQITLFIFLITFALDLFTELIGMENILKVTTGHVWIGILVSGLVGLIPNCAASVAITSFYLDGVLSVGSMMAGLLSCAGIGFVVLFKNNRNVRTNCLIVAGIYVISVFAGFVTEFMRTVLF